MIALDDKIKSLEQKVKVLKSIIEVSCFSSSLLLLCHIYILKSFSTCLKKINLKKKETSRIYF